MTSSKIQPDLFGEDADPNLFGEAPSYRPDPDAVRAHLHRILAEARAAQKLPWDRRRTDLYSTVFPQMAQWLPDEEAAQLKFEFAEEMARLNAA